MPLTLMTLNIENDRHIDRVSSAISTHLPDIVCLQEALEKDCASLAAIGGYDVNFANSGRLLKPGSHEEYNWGLAVLSRVPVMRQTVITYSENTEVRALRQPNDHRRLVVLAELMHRSRPYRIATTHFTWTPDGQLSEEQHADFRRLARVLSEYPDYVLCGDFNAPRGRNLFAMFTHDAGLIDHLPQNVTSTIDGRFHRNGALELVVDTIFSTAEYQVSDVRVLDRLSDHKGILATVERR
jgi:endonuclease/exonuclease/phosphatase family metal-dependent hydrolase